MENHITVGILVVLADRGKGNDEKYSMRNT